MNLQKLKDTIQQYNRFLQDYPEHDPYWRWESQKTFQENWDIEASGFGAMYDRSLENSHTRRLWKRENYEPKAMMLRFIAMSEDFVRYMFQDLFNEKKEVDGRMGRFVFHCDELLREHRETHPHSKANAHFHDDGYQIISLYLAFRYPEQYTPYDFGVFRQLMALLGSRDVPKVDDTGRYFKVMRTIYNFIKKEEEILAMHRQRLNPERHFMGETLLVAEDFCRVVVRQQ